LVDKQLVEKIKEAIDTAKPRKFLESIEVAINLKDIDLTNPKNRINEEIIEFQAKEIERLKAERDEARRVARRFYRAWRVADDSYNRLLFSLEYDDN